MTNFTSFLFLFVCLYMFGCQGEPGKPGKNGTNCTVAASLSGESIIRCSDGTSTIVRNGLDGAMGPVGPKGERGDPGTPGLAGADGSTVEKIKLCPDVPGGAFSEYLLKIDGTFIGVYASGQKIGLVELWAGTWTTTDGRNCSFTITEDGQVI